MGAKANKYVAVAGLIVIGIAGAAQFSSGLSTLFGRPALPECASVDASDLVRRIIADNFSVQIERLNEVSEASFDEAGQKRGCVSVIDARQEGVFEIAYDLTWHDQDRRIIAADVQIVSQREGQRPQD